MYCGNITHLELGMGMFCGSFLETNYICIAKRLAFLGYPFALNFWDQDGLAKDHDAGRLFYE